MRWHWTLTSCRLHRGACTRPSSALMKPRSKLALWITSPTRPTSAVACAAIALASSALAAPASKPPPGFVSLFNGKDLTHWKVPEGDNGHWKVVNGVIDYDARSAYGIFSHRHAAEMEQERRLLIGAVVHDLRTPLQFVRSFAEAIEADRNNHLTAEGLDQLIDDMLGRREIRIANAEIDHVTALRERVAQLIDGAPDDLAHAVALQANDGAGIAQVDDEGRDAGQSLVQPAGEAACSSARTLDQPLVDRQPQDRQLPGCGGASRQAR